jgi:hypothetical protein
MDRHNILPEVLSAESALRRHGASAETVARCRALRMTEPDVTCLLQLSDLHNREVTELIAYVEQGFTLTRVMTALHLQAYSGDLHDINVISLCRAIEAVSFNATNLEHDLSTGRLLYHGRALTPRQAEQELLREIAGNEPNSSPGRSLMYEPYEGIIEVLIEGAGGISDDPLNAMLNIIAQYFDGDVLLVWQLLLMAPDHFQCFLAGRLSAERLRELMLKLEQGHDIEPPSYEVEEMHWDDSPVTELAIDALATQNERGEEIGRVARQMGKFKGIGLLRRLDLRLDDEADPKATARGLGLRLRKYENSKGGDEVDE